jgi:hypothetical protein
MNLDRRLRRPRPVRDDQRQSPEPERELPIRRQVRSSHQPHRPQWPHHHPDLRQLRPQDLGTAPGRHPDQVVLPAALSKGLSAALSPLGSSHDLFTVGNTPDVQTNDDVVTYGLFGLAVKTVVGGYASVLGGSKFANGAESGAFQYLLAQQSPGPGLNTDSDGKSGYILAPPSAPPAPKKPKPAKGSSAPPPVDPALSSVAAPTSAPATSLESDFESGGFFDDRIRGGLAIRGFEAQQSCTAGAQC